MGTEKEHGEEKKEKKKDTFRLCVFSMSIIHGDFCSHEGSLLSVLVSLRRRHFLDSNIFIKKTTVPSRLKSNDYCEEENRASNTEEHIGGDDSTLPQRRTTMMFQDREVRKGCSFYSSFEPSSEEHGGNRSRLHCSLKFARQLTAHFLVL